MGNALLKNPTAASAFLPPLLAETQIFALWTMENVRELLKRFQTQIHGFAIVEAQFETIIAFKPEVAAHVELEILFEILDNDHDGRIDGLELLGGIALCCHASFEEKARFCFELFDFNLNSLLSKKELTIMMMSSVCGMNLLTGGGEELEPDAEVFEKFAEDAIARADLNADGQISYEEFIFWARSNRDLMSGLEALNRIALDAKLDVQSDDSAPETADEDSVFGSDDELQDRVADFADDDKLLKTKIREGTSRGKTDKKRMAAPIRGDQALSVVPWLGQVHEPTNFKRKKGHDSGPETNLQLNWVFGNRIKGSVNAACYLVPSGSNDRLFVYTAAAVCVIVNTQTREQSFYLGHSSEVTAIAMHPSKEVVATADKNSNIHIWNLDKTRNPVSLIVIKAIVKSGIQLLSFSPNGEKIAAVGKDADHTVYIFNVNSGEIISSAKGMSSPNDVHDMAFSTDGSEIVLAGKNQIKFFVNVHTNRRALESKLGHIGSQGKRQVFCCATYMKEDAVVGCASGEIYRFHDCHCVQMVQAHGVREPVLCLYYNILEGTLISGGKDSLIKTWDSTLKEVGSAVDLSEDVDGDGKADTGSLNSSVNSIQQYKEFLLIGTLGCDIYEATLPVNPSHHHSLTQYAWGHSSGELWGLSMHPNRDEFVTVGDDKTIRIWSLRTHEQINIRIMPECARSVAYNNSGQVICVGMIDGSVAMLEATSPMLRVYATWNHSSRMINDIKFAPDDTILAVACADTNVYLYKSDDRKAFRRQAVCRGHSGAVTHIDFSANSQFLQSNGTDASILYWDISGNQIKQNTAMKDSTWATITSCFGWAVQGIWPKGCDYTDVNTCVALPDIGDIITGDDFGMVNLYRYPALKVGAIHQKYIGHAGHVTCVRFNWNRRYAVSIGGLDRTIIVWKHDIELVDSDVDVANSSSSASSGSEGEAEIALRKDHPEVGPRSIEQEAANLGWKVQDMVDFFGKKKRELFHKKGGNSKPAEEMLLVPTGGDQSAADGHIVPPWRSSIIEPTKWTSSQNCTDVDLRLEWVHGHRCHDSRNNVLYSAEGCIVYNAANLAVVYHKPSGKQRFLLGPHVDEVIGITIHPAGQIFATSEAGRTSNIVIWNSKDMSVLTRLEEVHRIGTALMSFNSSGNILASIGLDSDNTLSIHDWTKTVLILSTPTSKERIYACCFMVNEVVGVESVSTPSDVLPNQDIVVTVGHKYLKFWWWQGQNVQSQSAIWGNEHKEKKSTIMCVASSNKGICITGSSEGNLLVWQDFKLVCHVKHHLEGVDPDKANNIDPESNQLDFLSSSGRYPHRTAILALWAIPGSVDSMADTQECNQKTSRSARYISGDRDGIICIWRLIYNSQQQLRLVPMRFVELKKIAPLPVGFAVKSICERDGMILVGNNAGEIFEISYDQFAAVHEDAISNALDTTSHKNKEGIKIDHFQSDDNKVVPATRLSAGHGSGEVWGLVCHPSQPYYFTSGDDSVLKFWTLSEHRMLAYVLLPDKARSLDIREFDGMAEIAIGLNNGGILVLPLKPFFDTANSKMSVIDRSGGGNISDVFEMAKVAQFITESNAKNVPLPKVEDIVVKAGTVKYLQATTQWMQVLKYCFEGSFLVGGSQDSKIAIFDTKKNYAFHGYFEGHSSLSAITHIDFGIALKINQPMQGDSSPQNLGDQVCTTEIFDPLTNKIKTYKLVAKMPTDSTMQPVPEKPVLLKEEAIEIKHLIAQSTSSSGELIYWNVLDKTRINSISSVKDAWWATFTCPYGWAVQGVWPIDSTVDNNSDIIAVTRSHTYDKVPVIAAADHFGRLKLYNYPCVQPGAPDKCYRGHSSKVTNVQFNHDDTYCITTGGQDHCVFVWATDIQEEIRERTAYGAIAVNAFDMFTVLEVPEAGAGYEEDQNHEADDEFQIIKLAPPQGDEFGAIKPWKGAIREPSDWKEPAGITPGQAPDASLELKFVHGYRGWDCRDNIGFADSEEEIVYHIAGLGIVLDTKKNSQVLNSDHDDDILCLAVHPEGHMVATGEIGKFPKIILWDANTGVTIRSIMGHKKGVSHLTFANQGKMLISCGLDEDRMLMIHQVDTGALLGKSKAGRGVEIYAMAMSSVGAIFVTGGKNFIKFWEMPSTSSTGGELSSKSGIYNVKSVKARTICSAAYLGSDAITGMNDGSIVQWKERSCTKAIKAHQGAVTAMTAIPIRTQSSTTTAGSKSSAGNNNFRAIDARESGARILTGGKDGDIHMWDMQFNKIWSLSLTATTPVSALPQIQAMAVKENKLVIGTKGAEIYEVSINGAAEAIRHVQGHYLERSEVWGLASHPLPTIQRFVTSGDDMTVRLWDAKLFKQVAAVNVGAKARAIAFHPDGSQIAVALYDGNMQILSDDLKRVISTVTVSSSWSQCIAFSPDGKYLAVGCHDNIVYLLETKAFSCQAKLKGHHSFITALDFSDDSRVLQSTSGDYELLFWDTSRGKQITSPSDVRDTKWASATCTLGWAVQGIWPLDSDGTDVNTVDRSRDGKLLATGDDFRAVKLFRYPCYRERAQFKAYKGHSEHVLRVKFSADGKSLFSVGGLDKAVIQYEVKL